jgi:hypothetical protein
MHHLQYSSLRSVSQSRLTSVQLFNAAVLTTAVTSNSVLPKGRLEPTNPRILTATLFLLEKVNHKRKIKTKGREGNEVY